VRQEADQSAPQRRRGYYSYTRTEEGKQYAVHCRRRVPDGAPARPSGAFCSHDYVCIPSLLLTAIFFVGVGSG